MRKYSIFFLLIAISLCSKAQRKNRLYSNKGCPFELNMWMEVSDSIAKESQLQFGLDLNSIVKGLRNIIAGKDSAGTSELHAKVDRTNKNYSKKKASVSQAFYEKYLGRSIRLCDAWNYLKETKDKDPTKKQRLEKLLFDLENELDQDNKSISSGSLINISQQNFGSGNQYNNNQIYLHPEDTVDQSKNIVIKFDKEHKQAYVSPRIGSWKKPMIFVPVGDSLALVDFMPETGATFGFFRGISSDPRLWGITFNTEIANYNRAVITFKYYPEFVCIIDYAKPDQQYWFKPTDFL